MGAWHDRTMTFTPGFLDVTTQFGGSRGIPVDMICLVEPTRTPGGTEVCTVVLLNGMEVVIFASHNEVMASIAEAKGAIPAGTGAELDKLRAQIQDLTRRLTGVLGEIPPASDPAV